MRYSYVIFCISVLVFAGCSSNKGNEKLGDWKYTENIDQSKVVELDKESGRMFDVLTGASTGLNFTNQVNETFELNYYRYGYSYNGAGVGIGDINNDGLPDVFMTGNVVPDRLFLNKGNMKFEDITEKCGIDKVPGWSTSVTFVDVNEDGFNDIYVCRARYEDPVRRKNLLYINNGDLTFTEEGHQFGLDDDSYSNGANFFDADNDGDLDLYIVTNPTDFKDKNKQKNFQKIEDGTNMSNRFYRNDGNGKWVECHKEVGINNHGFGLSVTAGDLNNDDRQDVFVGNDYIMNDYVYINQGKGTFKESSRDELLKTSYYGMGTDIADFNNDGWLDMITVDMDIPGNYGTKTFMQSNKQTFLRTLVNAGYVQQYGRNALQLNNGFGKFSEIANTAGVSTTGWSWSPLFIDLDNDGYKDLYISNGFLKDSHMDVMETYIKMTRADRLSDSSEYYDLKKQIPKNSVLEFPDFCYHNNGDLTFSDVTDQWGLYYPSMGYGAAYADLDLDGDVDIVLNNANIPAFILRNNATKLTSNTWLRVKLKGEKGNPDGLGAKIYVTANNEQQLVQMESVKGYLSCSEPVAHFGLGQAKQADKVVVHWLDGKENTLTNVAANQVITVSSKDAVMPPKHELMAEKTLFKDETDAMKIDFVHKENDFEDFDREFLVPHKLSTLGPGIAVGDVNGDGLDDFFIGGAKDESGAIYSQTATGTFTKTSFAETGEDLGSEDMGAILFDADGDGDKDLYVCSGGSDFPKDDPHLQDRLYNNDGKGNFHIATDALPTMITSTSVVTAADYDKDGDLDLFVGGRCVPGEYPTPARSYVLQNNQGKFSDVTKDIAPELVQPGMVSSALWSDYNNDGNIDLVVTGEWMPISIYQNVGGKFKNVTDKSGLADSRGWWNSIVSGDFDNDGDIDYIAGNFGTDCRYKPKDKPIEIFYDDYDKNGIGDIIMAYWQYDNASHADKLYPIKTRERMMEQIDEIKTKFPNWDSYGRAEVWDFFGKKRLEDSKYHYVANTFYTSYIENIGNGQFNIKKLSNEMQISSVFGMQVMDVNNDGNLDVITHGNWYEMEIETNVQDASIGQILLGNGDGTFTAPPSRITGFYSPYNEKGMALISIGKENKPAVLLSASNGPLHCASIISPEKTIRFEEKDVYALITNKDGKTRKQEFYIGSGYLSQSDKMIALTPDIAKIDVYDSGGNMRTVFNGNTNMLTSK